MVSVLSVSLCAVEYPGEKLNAMLHVYIQACKYFITLHPSTDMYDMNLY